MKSRRAWKLRGQGWSEQRIADELGVNQSTVSRWLNRLTRRALASIDDLVTRELMATLGYYDYAVDESTQSWVMSKKPARSVRVDKRSGIAPTSPIDANANPDATAKAGDKTTVNSKEREGNPAFLQLALAAIDKKRQLLALDQRFAPPKEDDGPTGTTLAQAILEMEARDSAYTLDEGAEPPETAADEPDAPTDE